MSTTTKQTRQILANELGLTREAVIEIIDQRITAITKGFSLEALVEKAVLKAMDTMVKSGRHDWNSVIAITTKVAEKVIRERLVVSMRPPEEQP